MAASTLYKLTEGLYPTIAKNTTAKVAIRPMIAYSVEIRYQYLFSSLQIDLIDVVSYIPIISPALEKR
jgi:hypothetical protein